MTLDSDLLTYGLLLMALIVAFALIYFFAKRFRKSEAPGEPWYQGSVKQDWFPTGRIDFATQSEICVEDHEKPTEFRLLVEEQRIVESVAGNEKLEIHWRLATLVEAKTVVSHYHKYLSENSLIKSVLDNSKSSPTLTADTHFESDSAPHPIAR